MKSLKNPFFNEKEEKLKPKFWLHQMHLFKSSFCILNWCEFAEQTLWQKFDKLNHTDSDFANFFGYFLYLQMTDSILIFC